MQAQRDAIELFDDTAASPELCMRGRLEAGDIQLLNNHTCLHARDAFVDHSEVRLAVSIRMWEQPVGSLNGSRVGLLQGVVYIKSTQAAYHGAYRDWCRQHFAVVTVLGWWRTVN